MKTIEIINVEDNYFNQIFQYLESFQGTAFEKFEVVENEKDEILNSLKESVKELKSIKKGELEAIPIEKVLDEL
ncbi:hypothetical protein ThvES_00015420 [Thiovulum sp. ES]|nr:hypothetical protein ThvES_00015420 [Thiovulum sp. ES]